MSETEPTIDFRQKYLAIGRDQGRAAAQSEFLETLEGLAGEPDIELALQKRILAVRAIVTAATPEPSSTGGKGGAAPPAASSQTLGSRFRFNGAMRPGPDGKDLGDHVADRFDAARAGQVGQ